MRYLFPLFIVLFSLLAFAQVNPAWTTPLPPFQIADHLYYVGSEDLAAYLVTTPAGNILINANLDTSPPQIRASIEKLGFHWADTKILLNGQAHFDHMGGAAEILRETHAKNMVMEGDAEVVESGGRTDFLAASGSVPPYPPARVDRVLHDGDTVELGGTTLTAHRTAGHTRGCTTWTFPVHVLETLGKQPGMLGVIFRKAQNKIQDPAKLRRLVVDLIDKEQWSSLSADVKGDAYEGLLQKNAEDVKGGAGQYFTPRALIAAIVDVMAPRQGQTICDPACGTGGFLLAAHDYIAHHHTLDREQKKRLRDGTVFGIELVDSVTRLCAMNFLLHGIGGDAAVTQLPVATKDALAGKHGEYDLILANPPFGKKSSVTVVNEAGEQSKESLTINRDDFWASTSNKQLNFLQHIFTILKQHGRAAVVLPDNVLFEGGAGETIRRELLKQADVHTLLRLPTGIFYAQGVKANVLFFDRKPAREQPWTEKLWIYDLRTNQHFTLKERTLKRTDLDDFVACYHPANRHERAETERFKSFSYEELTKRDKVNLDIFWLKDESLEDSANLPNPDVLAAEIMEDLEAALEQFATIAGNLKR